MSTDQAAGWAHRLPPTPTAVHDSWAWTIARPAELTAARNELRRSLASGTLPSGADEDDVDRLLLAFEELASNGLRHSGAPVHVRVDGCDGGWLVDVSDALPDHPPVPAVDRDPALGGLGLHLIARLSTAFGWAADGPRKHVWAALVPAG
ncbi:histidine kinase [Modestobacter caceresii]|uniref:Histidine kinase n=1 Tax=Modestobacter caceresii TaxID=1522368 RepID=A0A098Y2G8_9ACTN|nr:ATP-binding protein [Modestobacter caceresii]KGH45103.1 histidine kinase [Modestobacter caceresii]